MIAERGKGAKDTGALPQMPQATGSGPSRERALALRRFHLTGKATRPDGDAGSTPAVLVALRRQDPEWRRWPLLIADGEPPVSLADRLDGDAGSGPEGLEALEALETMIRRVRGALLDRGGSAPCGELLRELLSHEDPPVDAQLEQALRELVDELADDARLVDLAPRMDLALFALAVRTLRRPARLALAAEVRATAARLEGLIRSDDARGPSGRTPSVLRSTLGAAADAFVDAERLSRAIGDPRGPLRLDAGRRARIGAAYDTLRRHAEAETPDVVLFARDAIDADATPRDWQVSRAEQPLRAARERFDTLATEAVELQRALRLARLELDGIYEAELHDPLLESLGWRDLTGDELSALPVVAVDEDGARLAGAGLGELSELLRSGRPLQLLVRASRSHDDEGTTFHAALGEIAVAHREAFVLQASPARPAELAAGLASMAASTRPAVALFAGGEPDTFEACRARLFGRATPCFRYDPARGSSWAERFDELGNPDPRLTWPGVSLPYRDETGTERVLDEALTFAHCAALDGAWRDHLLPLQRGDWDDALVEVRGWLELEDSQRAARLPFVWTLDGKGRLGRALVTRRLAFACGDRARGWRVIQELAGIDNVHALRAAGEVRDEARAEAERLRTEAERERDLAVERARSDVAADTVRRLVSTLMGETIDESWLDGAAPAAAVAVVAPAGDGAAAAGGGPDTEAEPVAEASGAAAEAGIVEGPYIDSAMCTTCNDCTKINSRMFRYNEDNQAYIADVAAGTFEQLVRAAEKCPARCIHPGAPRPGDSTATPALIERAAPFN
jgi:ferredoxin